MIPQAVAGVIWVLAAEPDVVPFQNPFLHVAVPTVAVFTLAYALSRTRYFIYGAALTVVLLPALIFAAVLTVNIGFVTVTELMIWLVMVVLIASVFFPVGRVALLTVGSLAGLMLMPLFSDRVEIQTIIVPVIYTAILSTLVLVAARHRDRVELDRQAELAESERRYRTLLETVFDGIILHDNEVLLDANTGFAEMFGYTRSEVIGRELSQFAASGGGNRQIAQAMMTGTKRVHETYGVKKDGTLFDIELVGKPQPYRGRIVQMAAVRDISERKRAEDAERKRRVLAEALREIAAALNTTLDLEEVLERILTSIGQVVPHDAANIILVEADAGWVVGCRGYPGDGQAQSPIGLRFALDEIPFLQAMIAANSPLTIPDTAQHEGWVNVVGTRLYQSYVGAPIRLGGEVIGFLNLESAMPDFFTPAHAEDLRTFADQAAVAIQNARLYKELQSYSENLEQAVEERTTELRQIKERVEAILNSSPDAILLLNVQGRIITANPAFHLLFGYDADEVYGKTLEQLIAASSARLIHRGLEVAFNKGQMMRLEAIAERRDGTTFDADLALAPVKDDSEAVASGLAVEGAVTAVVASFRDISVLKEVERMKDAFVSNVSHELRTPITSLKLNHALLKLQPENIDVSLMRMGREIERLQIIIEDLLRLSRLEQGQVELTTRPIDLLALAEQYVGDRTPMAESRELEIVLEADDDLPAIEADDGLLGQVLSVLLTNALSYTPAGGRITVRATHQMREGVPGAILSVSDTGPGIPPDEQGHLFERFFRGEVGRNSGMPGTGLGLAIAKEIVEKHGGQIGVTSQGIEGLGSTFTVWLPAAGPGG